MLLGLKKYWIKSVLGIPSNTNIYWLKSTREMLMRQSAHLWKLAFVVPGSLKRFCIHHQVGAYQEPL